MAKQRGQGAEGLLGHLEYEVMQALWREAPANVPAVLARINRERDPDRQLAYTTVMTVLARLHEKDLLDRERRGRGYDYTPRFDEPGLVEHLSGREVRDLLDRYGDVALAQFAAAVEQADPKLRRRLLALTGRSDDA
jgi:predicted transcriptional regulator